MRSRSTARWRALALATLALLATSPAAWASLDGEGLTEADDEHRLAEQLCRTEDPATMLAGMAAFQGLDVPPVRVRAEWMDVPLVTALAAWYLTLGIPLTPETLAGLADGARQFDPLVAQPLALLAMSIVESTRLNALAIREITPADVEALRAELALAEAVARGEITHEEYASADREALLVADSHVDYALQAAGALLLLEAVDVTRPLFEAATRAKAWPTTPAVADPVGLVRVGSTGPDFDSRDRYLLVDPGGNDEYGGRIGGGLTLEGLFPPLVSVPVGLGLELGGNDRYTGSRVVSVGAGGLGLGVMADVEGNDFYGWRQTYQTGGSSLGIGVFVDETGDDDHKSRGGGGNGFTSSGIALSTDLAGDDENTNPWRTQGGQHAYALNEGLAYWCDPRGRDVYDTGFFSVGYAAMSENAHAWFADLGTTPDTYHFAERPHAAQDNAYWIEGDSGGRGHGVDN